MKIYKKILNFGYGICLLLPIILLVVGFLFRVKNGETITLPISESEEDLQKLGQNFWYILGGNDNFFIGEVEWFEPFAAFNKYISTLNGYGDLQMMINDGYYLMPFVLLYSEWVVLVSFFRLFGSVFGCMINFADKMLDRIGGTN